MRGSVVVPPGVVEQAIFTWSKSNLGSGSGQGIGEVSPGLREHVRWLYSLDLDLLRPLASGSTGGADGYPGWEKLVAVGALPAGDLNVVFRALAKAGRDGSGRDRFLVHMLVGRSDELDVGSAAVEDPRWLGAEQCPADQLPRLETLRVADLAPHRADHDCAELDAEAEALLDDLVESPERVVRPEPAVARLTTVLLAAIPTGLWGQMRVGWSVGRESPLATIDLSEEGVATLVRPKLERARLGSCAFHDKVDAIWDELPAQDRSWRAFARAYALANGRTLPAHIGAGANGAPSEPDLDETAPGEREQVLAEIAMAIGAPCWDESRMLSDGEALRVLGRLEGLPALPEPTLDLLTKTELRALFGRVESNNGFSRSLRYLDTLGVGTDWLIDHWRETSLAVFCFAALTRAPGRNGASSWAVPKVLDPGELNKLIRHLRRIKGGTDYLAELLASGFASSGHARRDFVDAMLAANASSQEVFEVVTPRAGLAPRVQAELMRENLDLVIDWLGVPESSMEAFKLGFGRRRFSFASLWSPAKMSGNWFDGRSEHGD